MRSTHLIESMKEDGTCYHTPLYLRDGGLGEAQQCGPFTVLPFEAMKVDNKELAAEIADACNMLFPLRSGGLWTPVAHGFH